MQKKMVWASIVLSILGFLDSLYLLIFKLSKNNAMCLGNGDCSTVNASRYSTIYGIPVSLLGMIAYLAIIVLLVMELKNMLTRENSNLLVFGLSLVGVLFSAYLTYIELYVIFAICPFCVASAVIITLIFIISIIRLARASS